MPNKGRVLDVECQCGALLFEYFKAGRGRLIKCFLDQIQNDRAGVIDLPRLRQGDRHRARAPGPQAESGRGAEDPHMSSPLL